MKNFIIFWPGKKIPDTLEEITFQGDMEYAPKVGFGGFGVAWHNKICWQVALLSGYFIKIDAGGAGVTIRGMRGGVNVRFTTGNFINELKRRASWEK